MVYIKKIAGFSAIILMMLFLCSGCLYHKTYYKKMRLVTKNEYEVIRLSNQLHKNYGVLVFSSGAYGKSLTKKIKVYNIELMIPEKNIFNPQSANLNEASFDILDNVVSLLNCFDEEVVIVQGGIKGINCTKYSGKYTEALALEKAHSVAKYLWSQGVNATFLYTPNKFLSPDYVTIKFKGYTSDSRALRWNR